MAIFSPPDPTSSFQTFYNDAMFHLYKGYVRVLENRVRQKMFEQDINEDEMMECNDDCTECFIGGISEDEVPRFTNSIKEVNQLASIVEDLSIL